MSTEIILPCLDVDTNLQHIYIGNHQIEDYRKHEKSIVVHFRNKAYPLSTILDTLEELLKDKPEYKETAND